MILTHDHKKCGIPCTSRATPLCTLHTKPTSCMHLVARDTVPFRSVQYSYGILPSSLQGRVAAVGDGGARCPYLLHSWMEVEVSTLDWREAGPFGDAAMFSSSGFDDRASSPNRPAFHLEPSTVSLYMSVVCIAPSLLGGNHVMPRSYRALRGLT